MDRNFVNGRDQFDANDILPRTSDADWLCRAALRRDRGLESSLENNSDEHHAGSGNGS